jgi:hypothetical protein
MLDLWTRESPFPCVMLSGGSAWMGAVRGMVTAQARRQQAAMARECAKEAETLGGRPCATFTP